MASRSLSPREGRLLPSGGPYEGTPPHLRDALVHWFEDLFTGHDDFTDRDTYDNGRMLAFAAAAHVDLFESPRDRNLLYQITEYAEARDDESLLDLIHYALQIAGWPYAINALDQLLTDSGSVWTATSTGLQRRVAPPVQAAFDAATVPQDVASDELSEAWTNAYGRKPDPSDAWDHSIKAVEAVLRAVVCPNDTNATLGRIIGTLDSQSDRWKLVIRGQPRDYSAVPLVQMLRLMWPDPNRHGSPTPEPQATIEEARAVVQLAVAIVQWGRDGQIRKK